MYVRRLIAKLEIHCSECQVPIPRGDIETHKLQYCPKRSGLNTQISEVSKIIYPLSPPNTPVSEKKGSEACFYSEHQLNKKNKVKGTCTVLCNTDHTCTEYLLKQ